MKQAQQHSHVSAHNHLSYIYLFCIGYDYVSLCCRFRDKSCKYLYRLFWLGDSTSDCVIILTFKWHPSGSSVGYMRVYEVYPLLFQSSLHIPTSQRCFKEGHQRDTHFWDHYTPLWHPNKKGDIYYLTQCKPWSSTDVETSEW